MSAVPALNLTVENADNARLAHVCGPLDGNLRLVEERLGLEIRRQGDTFNVVGAAAEMGCDVLRALYERAGSGLRPEDVHLALVEAEMFPCFAVFPAAKLHLLIEKKITCGFPITDGKGGQRSG